MKSVLFLSCIACLLLAGSAFAQPITVLDRIGTNSAGTDNHPGGMVAHYHTGSTELWGTCGTVWTQPFAGTLGEVAFVLFARVVNATNGNYLTPVSDLSGFPMSLHLWTNGAAGFLAGSNSAHGDIVLPLGNGPAAPALWGSSTVTNVGLYPTNLYLSVLPTIRFSTNLAALNVRLEGGREYVLALVFEGANGNVVIRHSTSEAAGSPDVFGSYASSRGLLNGYTTNAFSRPQFATAISVLPDAPALAIQAQGASALLSWPESAGDWQLWSATNLLPPVSWEPRLGPRVTNAGLISTSLTPTNESRFFRLRGQ